MSRNKERGDRGEAEVAEYLRQRGYQILDRQWRCRFGELDLVAESEGGTLCFVEVKLRSSTRFGLPREAVDRRKQERLRAAAASYLGSHERDDCPCRFDVAEVYADERQGTCRVNYLEGAFQ